jgi:thymidylate synthase (FAD)
MNAHAQYEIRVYGEAVAEITKKIVPMAWEAFEDYVLKAEKFTWLELCVLKEHLNTDSITKESLESKGFGKREVEEFLEKVNKLKV